jgi:hypothetical protein
MPEPPATRISRWRNRFFAEKSVAPVDSGDFSAKNPLRHSIHRFFRRKIQCAGLISR